MGKRTNHKLVGKVFFFIVILFICSISEAKVIYVDDSAAGANDGSSWTDAYIYLQDALTEAAEGDEIRVAHGVYTPDLGAGYTPGDRFATFQLKNGVTIKGGYVGLDIPEKSDERAFDIFETILSNDLNGENDPNIPGSNYTSNIIVTGSYTDETAVLDGFTFTIISNMSLRIGESTGIYINSGSPTISNCTFVQEDSTLYTRSKSVFRNSNESNPTITGCTFISNTTGSLPYSLFSDAIMENDQSSPVLTDCTFKNNQFCMNNESSNVELYNCIFEGNSGPSIMQDGGNLKVEGCSFSKNPITYGPGMGGTSKSCIVISNSNVTVKDSMFTENSFNPTSSSYGGCACIYNSKGNLMVTGCTFSSNSGGTIYSGSVATINNCSFLNNSTDNLGGAISGSNMTIENCRFSGNSANEGGAIVASASNIHNCIFEANTANNGSAISVVPTIYRELYNCVFYGNSANPISVMSGSRGSSNTYTLNLTNCIIRNNDSNFLNQSNINAAYCNIEGDYPGEGNIDIDPMFVKAGYWADVNNIEIIVDQEDPNAIWIMGDYHLKSMAGRWDSESESWVKDDISSPCIDAGNINSPIGYEPFPNGGISNIGAYGRSAQASKTYFENNDTDVILAADINGDSAVDYYDLNIVISQWLLEGKDFINQPPVVNLIEPKEGDQITYPGKIQFKAQIYDPDGEIASVTFQIEQTIDNLYHAVSTSGRKEGDFWVAYIPGSHNLNIDHGEWTASAIATDNIGLVAESKATINIVAP